VGVTERARVRAGFLSGGEQQRVAVARLVVQDPAIIVADEPVSSLDPARAEEVMDILTASAREAGKTLLATVHSIDLARTYFGRLIGIRNGELEFDLPSKRVTDDQLDALYALQGLRDE
jgi:phosphonate transport system ATP-binding protein